MSGRRDADEGDDGDAGKKLLNQLVRRRLEVSVRNGQPNVVIDLLQYAVTTGNRRVAARVPNRSNPPRHRGLPVHAEGHGAGGHRLGSRSKAW